MTYPGERAAAIDVGTNSVKVVAGELDRSGQLVVLADASIIARLGEGVDATGKLSSEAQERAIDAIRVLLDTINGLSMGSLRIVSTSAVRDAVNREDFVRRVKSELGLDLEVLSEHEEGCLSFAAVALDPVLSDANGERAVIDIGGGSTELTFGVCGRVTYSKSVKVGAVRLTERILKGDPPRVHEVAEAGLRAEQAIAAAIANRRTAGIVGVGGSVVNLARIVRKLPTDRSAEIHGTTISRLEVDQLVGSLSKLTIEERRTIVGLDPRRADIIVAGAIILDRAMAMLDSEELTVSRRGLRYGVLYQLHEIGRSG